MGIELEKLDLRVVARELTAPALVMHEPVDREVPFSHCEAVAKAWPGSRSCAMADIGHARALRKPEVMRHAVELVVSDEVHLACPW